MAGSVSNSWHLVKASAGVLKLDKELMIFPLLSGLATLAVTASFFVPAAIAATVGLVLRFLSERAGFLGRIVIGLVGMGWSLATSLTVPVLVNSGLGPIDAVKESARLFRRTWGEQVVGNFGMGWAFFLMGLSWTLVGGALVLGSVSILPKAFIPAVGIFVLGYVILGLFSSALRGVYTAALYRYATKGEAGYFDDGVLRRAFVARR